MSRAQDAKTFAKGETELFTMMPTIYNADTLGIRPDLVGREITTWADIMDPTFKGKTSILNIPSIGIMDAAMIMEAMGNIKYADKGNMTKEEIDKTIEFLIKAKQDGQFRAFWKIVRRGVNLMASGEVVIQSMWSPAVAAVRSKGIACKYQPLKEGYRSWGGGLGLASHLKGAQLDAAYEYINWYTSGWVGGYLNRQGYYSACMDTAKKFMSADEWGYWIEGKAGAGRYPLPGRQGHGEGRRGSRRRLVRRAHGPCRVLELRHGRRPLHGSPLERVHRGLRQARRCSLLALPTGRRALAGARRNRPCGEGREGSARLHPPESISEGQDMATIAFSSRPTQRSERRCRSRLALAGMGMPPICRRRR